jgi:hypothetical protein
MAATRHQETAGAARLTAHFADGEIAHLERMIRSPHWHRNRARQAPYWRRRIEALVRDADLLVQQRARLDALLAELAALAAALAYETPGAVGEAGLIGAARAAGAPPPARTTSRA